MLRLTFNTSFAICPVVLSNLKEGVAEIIDALTPVRGGTSKIIDVLTPVQANTSKIIHGFSQVKERTAQIIYAFTQVKEADSKNNRPAHAGKRQLQKFITTFTGENACCKISGALSRAKATGFKFQGLFHACECTIQNFSPAFTRVNVCFKIFLSAFTRENERCKIFRPLSRVKMAFAKMNCPLSPLLSSTYQLIVKT